MFITGLGSAAPPHKFTQAECWQALVAAPQFPHLSSRSRAILKKVLLSENGISTRHFAMDRLEDAFAIEPDVLQARFAKAAPEIAAEAAERALVAASVDRSEIDALLISTCTGYLCPGLTSYVSEKLGLRSNISCLDLVGQGCGAAVPNLATANALIARGARHALSICVEVCSAALYLDDDPGVLISACLFGDAAAAAVCSREPGSRRSLKWLGHESSLQPRHRDLLRFEHRGGMLRNVLDKRVPFLVTEQARAVLEAGAKRLGADRANIGYWILHPGGRDVLNSMRAALELTESNVVWSASVLRDYGNVSSPSVLLAMERALAADAPPGLWWLAAFGAGISCHGAFLEG
jgi:predicted naringenin-chalcone synthase